MPVLTGIDVLGIQGYVFASNRLRDVLAASWMVSHVTGRGQLESWRGIDNVLLDAGGTAIVELRSLEAAKRWTALYTRWLLETAPGLEVVIQHRPFETRSLAWALKALQIDLARAKLERRPSVPQLGLSVTARCAVTGLPAAHRDQGELVSARVKRLRDKVEVAKTRWAEFLPEHLPQAPAWQTGFPDELDLMGRTHGETSVVGVVHVDGNGVGETISNWLKRCLEEEVDDAVVRTQYREWSQAIRDLGRSVLRWLVKRAAACTWEEAGHCVLRGTPYELDLGLRDGTDSKRAVVGSDTVFLPLRPILLGGDDLTFACDGRIALDLAATAVREFQSHPLPHLGKKGRETTLSACAGVALVKAHAPFHRSYGLAEELCRSAKLKRRTANDKEDADTGSWLDWHLGATRPGEPVEDIRGRQYQQNRQGRQRASTMRPYPLAEFGERKQSWEWLDSDVLGPQPEATEDDSFRGFDWKPGAGEVAKAVPNAWSGSRSRVKMLGALAAEGGDRIDHQVKAWQVVEQRIRLPGGLTGSGELGPLRDAIELMDLHLRLEPDPRAAGEADTGKTSGTAQEGDPS